MVIKGISQEQLYELKRVQQHFEGVEGKIINVESITDNRTDVTYKVTISIEGVGFKRFLFKTINRYVSEGFDVVMKKAYSIVENIGNKEETKLSLHTINEMGTCDSTMVYRDTRTNNYWIVADYIETKT